MLRFIVMNLITSLRSVITANTLPGWLPDVAFLLHDTVRSMLILYLLTPNLCGRTGSSNCGTF